MDLQPNQSRKIHLLPEHIVDQIKAGEVVERPSALLKELIENSIDADSKRLDIQIRDNGLELISIEDDGEGMDVEDLPYAFCRHATSKITQFDDLYRLQSYGFRGEALASISSIARITCTSSPKKDPSRGGKIVFHGGKQEDWSALPTSTHGTSLFVKDLFFNTPARLKFLKSKTAEKNALQKIFYGFLLTQPQVSFSIKWDDKEKVLFPRCSYQDIKKRVSRVFFKKNPTDEDLSKIKMVSAEFEGTRLRGYYSTTTTKGAAGKAQYFFVNGRMFVDKALHQAFLRAAENEWNYGEFGHYCFFIDLPPDQVDVNVHPGKIHVKFQKPQVVFGLVSNCIEKKPREDAPSRPSFSDRFTSEALWNSYSHPEVSGGIDKSVNYGGNKVFNIQDGFLIFRDEEKNPLLVNINIFLSKYLRLCFSSKEHISGTPLLIGEALSFPKGKIDEYLGELAPFGIEIDRVDPETLILRTIHPNLVSLNLHELLTPLLKNIVNNSGFNLDNFLCAFENQLYKSLKIVRFESLWKKFEDPTNTFNEAIVEFDSKKLNSFFTEES